MVDQLYSRKLQAAAFVRKSKLIVGLDLVAEMGGKNKKQRKDELNQLEKKALEIVAATAESAVAFKFNRQLVLPLGVFDRIPGIIDAIHEQGLTAIMDCKINDIGNTNAHIARYYFDAGFDAIITNPFVGWEGGLDSVFELARKRQRGVITLCYMSHPAADEGYGLEIAVDKKKREPVWASFAQRAQRWGADGVIVGATYPERIQEVSKILGGEIPIISPGVGSQGGKAREAIDAGASYVIVARSIVNADDPGAAAAAISAETK
ncbi:MAG: orotidine 5'-phosphate decarboxylase / HUMPS family protein [Candidatus Thorarchaeota archaeon]|jgi:orotidine-5'-phosphate decarboxylase